MAEDRLVREICLAVGALPGVLVYENGTQVIEKTAGGKTWREHNGLGPGTPDVVMFVYGLVGGCEVKTPEGQASAKQLEVQAAWRESGTPYEFIRSVDGAKAFVMALTKRAKEMGR